MLRLFLCLALLLAAAGPSMAGSDWPSRSVRIVVPFAPGGTTDIVARVLATELSSAFGQAFVVDNRAGAGGNIGATEVARSAPDGYTLLMGTPGTQAINAFLYGRLNYDPQKDFTPVSLVASVPNVLVVHPSLGVADLREFIALGRTRPGQLNYGSAGNGTTGHLATELLKSMAGLYLVHIPYRGSAAALQDAAAGQVQLSIDNLPSALPYIRSGRLIALGVTSRRPNPVLPEVPPIGSILTGYEAESWFALMAPAGTPASIVDALAERIEQILRRPEIAERLRGIGAEPAGGGPVALGAFIADERRKWQRVVEVSGARVD